VRTVAAIVVAAHGIGFSMWFLASWFASIRIGTGTQWLLPGDVEIASGTGRAFGVLSLLGVGAFLATAWGILGESSWWPPLGGVTALASFAIVIPWWTIVRPFNAVGATLVNLLLIAAWLVPSFGDRIVGAS
jgi:hypothetical protein